MASVRIPTPLRKLTNDLEVVSAAGANVGELIANLDLAFPGLRERICDEQGAAWRAHRASRSLRVMSTPRGRSRSVLKTGPLKR
jgi:hypothetical protein